MINMTRFLLLRRLRLEACLLFMAVVGFAFVHGFVPPPMAFEVSSSSSSSAPWEPVNAMRRRLGINYNYTPDLLNPEMCRYLSELECRDANDAMRSHSQKARKLPSFARQQQQRRRQIEQQPPGSNTTDNNENAAFSSHQEEPQNQQRKLNPFVGVVKVLVLLIQFPDHTDRELPDPVVYNEMWNSNANSDLIPSGSIAEWFKLNSHGLYEIEADIVPWTVTDNSEVYYSFESSGLVPTLQRAFWPALDRLDQQGMDWSQYDIDEDGKLDAVVALHTGYSAELKGVDCNNNRDYSQRIWSQALANSGNSWTSLDGSYSVGGYAIASAYKGICGSEPANIGTMTHEFMHTLGLIGMLPT